MTGMWRPTSPDVGQHQMWAAQFYKFDEPRRWINPAAWAPWAGIPLRHGIAGRRPGGRGVLHYRRGLGADEHPGAVHLPAVQHADQDLSR